VSLTPGSRLGPYQILAPLGAGGMGEVYRARDLRLGRDVAIKVLPASLSSDPERLRRFAQEARAASVLNHPNITAVHDIGEHDGAPYVVQELLEGETLRARLAGGALPVRKAIDYGMQIAQGLAAVQEKGIVHRDLKPENLFLTKDGRVKILDFGLAKPIEATETEPPTQAPTAAAGTEAGAVLGTIGYMSPEQLRGKPADARSDIFAFGAVLYEMLSGQRAFRGGSAAETISAILTTEPRNVSAADASISRSLQEIVFHCLEKAPEQRFQSARDVAFALQTETRTLESPSFARSSGRRRWRGAAAILLGMAAVGATLLAVKALRGRGRSGGGAGSIRSIAVLPLTSFSADPEQEFFADSMTDAIITDLAKIEELRVVSRTSVMRYKRTQKSVPEIARELGVDGIVEGSVERSQNRVRITAQLIRAPADQHLWADSYERDLKDVLVLQDQVARSIAREIQVKLTPLDKARLKSPRAVDPAAFELCLKGRYFWTKRTPESIQKAIGLFGQAIDTDPTYAYAYAGLSACYVSLGFSFDVGSLPPNEAIPKAKAAASKAIEIDDSLAEAHNPLAFIRLNYDWDSAGAEREFKRALDLNPGYADAHHWYAHYLIATGRPEESLAESNRALELDPLSPIMSTHLGWLYYYLRRNDQALSQLGKTLELDPNYGLAHWYIGLVKEQQGRYDEALDRMSRAVELLHGNLVVEADRAHALALSKRTAEAEESLGGLLTLSRTRYVNPVETALVYIGLGKSDEAFRWLDRAYEERSDLLVYLRVDPRFDPIRSDPRFAELIRRVGLPG
jgi:eukaryotic-like serine/threonine-protein kinase